MSKLFIVPTPIGNLEDMTFRAVDVLKASDVIYAEDTRNSVHLLKHFSIDKPLRSYHQHNEHKIVSDIVSLIGEGKKVSLISDAGTPGISDPGFLLVRECIAAGLEVETLPGATAFVPALVNSGLPCDTFLFVGFLPQKKGRQTKFKSLQEEKHTMILYESPFRLVKTLEELKEYLGPERRASVSRELTKIYEENKRGTLTELAVYFSEKTVKGEIVIIVEGQPKKSKHGQEEEA
jgi:16S rRNA (cytidine1402-2'-O)-methyltransferase